MVGFDAHRAGDEGGGERGVERLDDARPGEGGGDLGGLGRWVGGHDERVEGLEVHRVGDVDDDLARQAGRRGAARASGDGGVRDREDDEVARDLGGAVGGAAGRAAARRSRRS